jgi:hypothetical protein
MRFLSFRSNPTNDDLAIYLRPPSDIFSIGHETGLPKRDGIAKFVSPHGSYRYVFYVNHLPVSALQVMSRDRKTAVIANVYTLPQYRRQYYATRLLDRTRQDFKTVMHAEETHISKDGLKWRDYVG